MTIWLQNEYLATALYWIRRGRTDPSGGLAEHVFRKGYLRPVSVVIGRPRATAWRTVAELEADGVCGLYGVA